jgi:hypothetical protein
MFLAFSWTIKLIKFGAFLPLLVGVAVNAQDKRLQFKI